MTSSPKNQAGEIRDLLVQSLQARVSLGNEKATEAYLTQARAFFMKQWVRLAPGEMAIDGKSILVLAFQSTPSDAMAWADLVGDGAWTPSDHHPYPLVDMFPDAWRRTGSPRPMSWPRGALAVSSEVGLFLQNGMRLAMPVRSTQPKASVEDLQAQQALGRFCAQDCPLFSAKQKTGWLLEHEGAVVIKTEDIGSWIEQDLVGPDTPIWLEHRVGMSITDGRHARTTMLDAWLQHPGGADKEIALAWLKGRGAPQHTLDRVPAALLVRAARSTGSWQHVEDLILEFENGWAFQENEDSPLAWQSILARKPEVLKDMVSHVDARTLAMRADNGMGIWDCLAMAVAGETHIQDWPGFQDVQRLDRKVPFRLAPTSPGYPLIFKARQIPYWRDEWLDESIGKDPLAWVGPLESQAEEAAQLLWGLQVGENVSNAGQRARIARQIRLLHRAWKKAPDDVCPAAVSVLCGVQHYLDQYNLPIKEDLWELMEDRFPEPQVSDLGWVKPLLDEIQASKRKPKASRQALERTLTWLHMHTLPEPSKSRRTPRL